MSEPPASTSGPQAAIPDARTGAASSSSALRFLDGASYSSSSESDDASESSSNSIPGWVFFYGTLAEPDLIEDHLKLCEPLDIVIDATVQDFKIKLKGDLPTLVSEVGQTVQGFVWEVKTWDDVDELVHWETSLINEAVWCECVVELEGGTILAAHTFKWGGDPDSSELEDGVWDIEKYYMG